MTLHLQRYRGYRFGSHARLAPEQLDLLIDQFELPPCPAKGILGGRNAPRFSEMSGFGRIFVKHYLRGGVIRHFNRRTYLRLGKSRSEAEFEILSGLRKIGLDVPDPVVFATRGGLFYRGWLVTRVIPDALPLIDICRADPDRAKAAMPAVTRAVRRLVDSGTLHVDLHPGNVLLDGDDRVFLIDFDKARGGVNPEAARAFYIRRWRKAIRKYELPGFLERLMTAGLSGK